MSAKTDHNEFGCFKHDDLIEVHTLRMATPAGKAKYAAQRHRSERPFSQIKHHFEAREFLLRGLNMVCIEWTAYVRIQPPLPHAPDPSPARYRSP